MGWKLVCGWAALLTIHGQLQAQSEPRAIVEQAVAAAGGMETLSKHPGARIKMKGVYQLQGKEAPFTGQSVYLLPDRARSTLEMTIDNVPRSIVQVLNGDKGAMFFAGLAQQVTDAQLQEMRMAVHCQNVAGLTPLLSDRKFTLASVGEKTVDGEKLIGVRVASPGFKDVTLYFSEQTHLLSLLERPGFDSNGKPIPQTDHYSDYRTANGQKYAAKLKATQGGKVLLQSEILDFVPLQKVDAKEFALTP